MKQFINGNDSAFDYLAERAQRACIRFRRQEMPPGCLPVVADVGFEVHPDSGAATLWVAHGVTYRGLNASVRQWLADGSKRFPSFGALRSWISGPLADAFGMAGAEPGATVQGAAVCAAGLTDIDAVRQAVREADRPVYLDENQLFERLGRRVLGQDEALLLIASVMVRHCARRRPARPAVLFAVGPSGVGKTKAAESLAQVLREMEAEDSGYQFLRLDMTEYQEAHRVSQLIGAPQGYIGHGQGSQLLDALRANGRTIVLFDEIEKAHPAIMRVLMNAMDAGRLSASDRSANGREIDCRFAVFMFTSNLDASGILDELASRSGFGNRGVEDEVCRRRLHAAGVAPEIVGRIGRFLVFRPLTAETRAEIMALAVAEIANEYGLEVAHVAPAVIVQLMQKVRSQGFGVRPERFLIDDALGAVFAKAASEGVATPIRIVGPPFQCQATGNPGHEDGVTVTEDQEPHEGGGDADDEP